MTVYGVYRNVMCHKTREKHVKICLFAILTILNKNDIISILGGRNVLE
jgi:hypothetical protein